jgi:hypothetical protein
VLLDPLSTDHARIRFVEFVALDANIFFALAVWNDLASFPFFAEVANEASDRHRLKFLCKFQFSLSKRHQENWRQMNSNYYNSGESNCMK